MYIHNLNPVIFDFGFLSLNKIHWHYHWYCFWMVVRKKIILIINERSKDKIELNLFDDFITYVIISIIIGAD